MSTRKNNDILDALHEQSIDVSSRTIYLIGAIDETSVATFVKNIRFLDKTQGDITIIISSEGGSVDYGFAAYDAILSAQNNIIAHAKGGVMSMASIIFQAADMRIMHPNSYLMVHPGQLGTENHALNFISMAEFTKTYLTRFVDIYYARIVEAKKERGERPISLAKFKSKFKLDWYLWASDAIEMGLADIVYE